MTEIEENQSTEMLDDLIMGLKITEDTLAKLKITEKKLIEAEGQILNLQFVQR
jgi:hypothetical protein